ncbi:MAG: PorT family protein [Bacteroidales bacterium]|nr:PorT family protein [Bacteroidales bacterium]
MRIFPNSISIFAILLFSGAELFSQPFHGGLTAGLTASQVDGDSYSGYNKPGIQAGVFVSAELFPWLDARMEIKYTSRGAREPADDDNTGSYLLGLHYIDIPVMALLKYKKTGAFELGLIPGYLFKAAGDDENGSLPDEYLVDFRKFDLGLLIGAEINITQKIAVNIRYSYSVFSIRDPDSAGSYYSWFGKIFGHSKGDFNNYLALGINYRIR